MGAGSKPRDLGVKKRSENFSQKSNEKRGPEQLFRGFVGDEILPSYVGNIQ